MKDCGGVGHVLLHVDLLPRSPCKSSALNNDDSKLVLSRNSSDAVKECAV